ncbi:MAG: hypothetical protein AB1782_07670 [Cyanobacteriota bacterium]
MKQKRNSGSGLVEYVIPTAIIGILVGLTLYCIFNDKLLLKFLSASANGSNNNGKITIGSNGAPGPLISSPNKKPNVIPNDDPVIDDPIDDSRMKCVNGLCTIDFGDYIITGIPENFGPVTTAKRGGEETLAYVDILMQMADILEQQGDTSGSNLLRQLADQAKKMAATEIGADEALENLNNIQQQMGSMGGNVYENVQNGLASVDPGNIQPGDCLTLIAAAKYMESVGLIDQNELQTMIAKVLEIKNQAPSLSLNQVMFINKLKASPESVNSLIAMADATLSSAEKAILINQNKMLYSLATNSLDGVSNTLDSVDNAKLDAGKKFDDIYQQAISQLSSHSLGPIVEFVGNQVQTIGNSVTTSEVSNKGYSLLSLTIPENAGVETAIAAAMLNAADN